MKMKQNLVNAGSFSNKAKEPKREKRKKEEKMILQNQETSRNLAHERRNMN